MFHPVVLQTGLSDLNLDTARAKPWNCIRVG